MILDTIYWSPGTSPIPSEFSEIASSGLCYPSVSCVLGISVVWAFKAYGKLTCPINSLLNILYSFKSLSFGGNCTFNTAKSNGCLI